jgi:hypothetical protein
MMEAQKWTGEQQDDLNWISEMSEMKVEDWIAKG